MVQRAGNKNGVRLRDQNDLAFGVKQTANVPHVLIGGAAEGATPIDTSLKMMAVSGTLGALNAELCLENHTESMGTLVFQVSGTWSGKIVVEGAIDGVYNNLSIVQPGGTIAFTGVNNDNQNGVYRALLISGYTHVRLRMSTYSSGSASVVMNGAPLVATPFAWQLTPANLQMTANQGTPANLKAGVQLIDESGNLYGVKHIQNKPRVSAMPYLYDIAEGNVTDHTPFAKLGYNGDVGATEEDLITQGGIYPWIPAGGVALEVVSSNAQDTLTGTGVQKVRISYLDTDYSAQSQIISMNGVTPVPLTDTSILRVNSIRATQVGTGLMAAGDITCRLVGGAATIYRQIPAGFTRGRGATYTVPLGKTLYLTSISVFSGFTTAGKVVRWFGRAQVDDTAPTVKIDLFQVFFEAMTQDNNFHCDFDMPVRIPATADLKISAVSNQAGSFCSCALRGWLE